MYFKLALYQLKKRPFVNLVVICQFVIAIYLICLIAARLPTYFTGTRIIGGACKGESYYIYADFGYEEYISDKQMEIYDKYDEPFEALREKLENNKISEEEFNTARKEMYDEEQKELSEYQYVNINPRALPHIQKDSYVGYSNFKDPKYGNRIYLISKDLSDSIKFNMKSGKWLSNVKSSNEYINMVAFKASNYSVGDIVDLQYTYLEYDEELGHYHEVKKPVAKGKIVGVINDNYNIDMGWSRGNTDNGVTASLEDFLDDDCNALITVYEPSNELYDGLELAEYLNTNHIFTLKDNATEEQINEFKKACTENHYSFYSVKNSYDYTYLKEKESFRNDIIFLISASLLSIVALIGISALGVSREVKNYSIYYLNGMSWKGCMKINIVFMSIIIAVSTVISALIKLYYAVQEYLNALEIEKESIRIMREMEIEFVSRIKLSNYFYYSKGEIIAMLIVVTVAFVSSLIIPYITFKKNTPVSILKGK